MILSGSISYGPLMPTWMFHAQVPPPTHQFDPNLPGITWVDLVFPFFIFCMGAAIPIAMRKFALINDVKSAVFTAFRRFFLLTFFALFLEHFKSARITLISNNVTYMLSMVGFILLLFSLSKFGVYLTKKVAAIINYSALVLAVACLFFIPLNNGEGFKIGTSDIIIIVLANMALFGTLVWWFTRNNAVLRVGILLFVMAIFLGSKFNGSWNEVLYNLTPTSAIYKFYFLKYLFILIPGTIAGDWLLQYKDINEDEIHSNRNFKLFGFILFTIIIANVYFLFTRMLALNLFVTICLLIVGKFGFEKIKLNNKKLVEQFFYAGTFSLLLGLTFEAYEGGIKKDFSTYSYYFVTVGFAFFSFIVLSILPTFLIGKKIYQFMVLSGQNPMMAYVAGSLLLLPLMHLTGLIFYWDKMNSSFLLGFIKGLLFTIVACGITIPFTKKGMVWKS